MTDAPTSAEPKFNFLEEMDIESMTLEDLKNVIAQFDISLVANPTQWERLCLDKNLPSEKIHCLRSRLSSLRAEYDYTKRLGILKNFMMIKRKLESFLAQSSIEKSFDVSLKELQKTSASCDHVIQKLSNPEELWDRFYGEISTIEVLSNQISNDENKQKENSTEKRKYNSRKTDELRRIKSDCYRFWDDVLMQIRLVNAIEGCWGHILREEVSWELINLQFKWTNDGFQAKYDKETEKRLWCRKKAIPPAELLRRIKSLQERYCEGSTAKTFTDFTIDSILKRIQLKQKEQQIKTFGTLPSLFLFPNVLDQRFPNMSLNFGFGVMNPLSLNTVLANPNDSGENNLSCQPMSPFLYDPNSNPFLYTL
ncbi:hypothetical protein B9Z55_020811 [Caenorhabditis nigoni]|uniref:Uncharacterized protein n=1 Tax=Caenorhabditis nigoni TaxID=1611254 RepID=A0A2G5TPE8_9PELO|nr:hypothetical protein B9Z55_020811 [Caenorhabditis nigoni]